MTLTVATTHKETGLTTKDISTIQPTSDKYKHIIDWLSNNDEGWTSTSASFNFKCSVGQNDFRLLFNAKTVVIGFTDKNGEPQQFIKTTKGNDLAFLMSD